MVSSDASGASAPGSPGGAGSLGDREVAVAHPGAGFVGAAAVGPGESSARPASSGAGSFPGGEGAPSAVKTFDELFAELSLKWRERTPGSGTVAALDRGVHHLGKKLVEEAAEAWMAAEHEGRERAAEELSQLLYWSQLMMISLGLSLDEVYSRL